MIKTYLFTPTETKENVPLDNWQSLVEDNSLLWVDVRSFTKEELDQLANQFGLHSITVGSILDQYRRPHLYEFKDHFYINMTLLKKGNHNSRGINPSELHLIAGNKFIITITREDKCEAVNAALTEYRDSPSQCERGSIYAVYLLAEDLVETYFPIVEKLDDEADKLENEMLDKADQSLVKKLFNIKRQVFELRRLLGPQRDIFNELNRRDFPFMQGESTVYFQDVYNRMVRVFDMLDTIREILSGNLDIYLSTVSNRLNEVMKVLTVFATILMMLSFITGFYGMNFTHLPWLRAPHAFRNMIVLMTLVTMSLLWWFRRKGWL